MGNIITSVLLLGHVELQIGDSKLGTVLWLVPLGGRLQNQVVYVEVVVYTALQQFLVLIRG